MKKTSRRTGRSSTAARRRMSARRARARRRAGAARPLLRFRLRARRLQRRRRLAPTWPGSPTTCCGDRALAVTALSESYPAHHYDLALTLARQAGFPHEVVHTREIERPEYPRQPGQPLLLLQGRALHRPRRPGPRARPRGRSSTATTPTIAATTGPAARRRAKPASAARSTKSASTRPSIRALRASRRPAAVGRAGVGVPVVARALRAAR